jgi:hypothetical protein
MSSVAIEIAQEFDQPVGGRPAIDDDAVAILDHRRRRAGNGALLGEAHPLLGREMRRPQMRLVPGAQSLRAAAHASQLAAVGHRVDVPADGGLGRRQQLHQLGDGDDGPILDQVADDAVTLAFEHGWRFPIA